MRPGHVGAANSRGWAKASGTVELAPVLLPEPEHVVDHFGWPVARLPGR